MYKYLIPLALLGLVACKPTTLTEAPMAKAVLDQSCHNGSKRSCDVDKWLTQSCPIQIDLATMYACWMNGYPINKSYFDETNSLPTGPAIETLPRRTLPTGPEYGRSNKPRTN